jgi:hypothetical protein
VLLEIIGDHALELEGNDPDTWEWDVQGHIGGAIGVHDIDSRVVFLQDESVETRNRMDLCVALAINLDPSEPRSGPKQRRRESGQNDEVAEG